MELLAGQLLIHGVQKTHVTLETKDGFLSYCDFLSISHFVFKPLKAPRSTHSITLFPLREAVSGQVHSIANSFIH